MKKETKTRLAAGGAATAAGAALVLFVGLWEGKRNDAYLDIVGIPTICYGETAGVRLGQHKSDSECKVQFLDSLIRHEQVVRSCLKDPDNIPAPRYQAYVSLEYNIGPAFCRSTVVRHANAGNARASCDSILLWNRAGGRVVRGLQRRREAERRLCLQGLS